MIFFEDEQMLICYNVQIIEKIERREISGFPRSTIGFYNDSLFSKT